ncbi:MAG: hypothetical protein HYV07_30505 [Deltaproteobacteria bacterium]|nr:hypothetical protein [Deltaproteobacteria bacterium]
MPRRWALAIELVGLVGCGPSWISEPPGSSAAGAVLYVGRHGGEWVGAARGRAPAATALEFEGSEQLFAGVFPVSLTALRIPEGKVAVTATGRPLPAAAATLAYDEAEAAWRPLDGWPAELERLRIEELPRDQSAAIESVRAGDTFSCALRGDGRASCWGYGSSGALGVEGVLRSETPTEAVVRGLEQLELGTAFGCGTDRNRRVLCWGDGSQLGRGGSLDDWHAKDVLEVSSAVSLGVGGRRACALDSAGRVRCWGGNGAHEVNASDAKEVDPPALISVPRAAKLGVGLEHACVLEPGGEVWCWGSNELLQLGAPGLGPEPVRVAGLPPAEELALGLAHSCALVRDGAVWCWGTNRSGQIALEPSPTSPPMPIGLASGELVVAGDLTCVRRSGDLHCLGGSVGSEVHVVESLRARSLGVSVYEHACAVTLAGLVECWGWGGLGQLGSLTGLARISPVEMPWSGEVDRVWAVDKTTCFRNRDGSIRCAGQPLQITPPLGSSLTVVPTFEDLGVAGNYSCVVALDGMVSCNGDNSLGQLGLSRETSASGAPAVVPGVEGVRTLAVADATTYALSGGGVLIGWGSNEVGQLGLGRTGPPETPVQLMEGVHEVAAKGSNACVIAGPERSVLCWGANLHGQVGIGRLGAAHTPERVELPGAPRSLTMGDRHACASLEGGSVWCWGSNNEGQLGDGSFQTSRSPRAMEYAEDVDAVVAGGEFTCAVHRTGHVSCVGANAFGQLGAGSTAIRSPVLLEVEGLSDVRSVRAGTRHACAVREGGRVSCWGSDDRGQLGLGTQVSRVEPAPVPGLP